MALKSASRISLVAGLHLVCHIDNDLKVNVSIRIHKALFISQKNPIQLRIRGITKRYMEATN